MEKPKEIVPSLLIRPFFSHFSTRSGTYLESNELKNEEDLRKCAVDADIGAIVSASVDNQNINNIDS